MATNKALELGIQINLPVASGVKSNDPVIIGSLMGVALADRDASGNAPVDLFGVYNLSVKGVNDAGNVGVSAGDAIYYVDTDTPKLSKKASGFHFGYALDAVSSGATTTIRVLVCRAQAVPGASQMAASVLRSKLFISTEQTGTGSAQNIAHGLGVVPTYVFAAPTDTSPTTAGVYTVTEGSHTSTNVVVTVTSGKKFKVLAIA